MTQVTIVGAGFSGLTLAYYLQKLGLKPVIIEKQAHCGGLISSTHSEFGLVESAANALLADELMEDLFADLGVAFAERLPARNKRYIYWNQPRRWPLTILGSLRALWGLLGFAIGLALTRPKAEEAIRQWATRVFGAQFDQRLLSPALQGIYAGDSRQLSAKLIVTSMLGPKQRKKRLKGSVSPSGGMGQLLSALRERLIQGGAIIQTECDYVLPASIQKPTVICTSAWSAAQIVKDHDQKLGSLLERCESLPVVSTTAFFEPQKNDLQGFGCLFPQEMNFQSLGVLFNSCIFKGRSNLRSETWIMGGFSNSELVTFNDEQILECILKDRKKMTGQTERPLFFMVNRWPRGLPHYTVEWEKALASIKVQPPLYLHGNYLGTIGLARICARSKDLAKKIKENHG